MTIVVSVVHYDNKNNNNPATTDMKNTQIYRCQFLGVLFPPPPKNIFSTNGKHLFTDN